jgi:hypothetical protein
LKKRNLRADCYYLKRTLSEINELPSLEAEMSSVISGNAGPKSGGIHCGRSSRQHSIRSFSKDDSFLNHDDLDTDFKIENINPKLGKTNKIPT